MQESAHLPRLVIAAPQGRTGKTTLCLGLAAALAARGVRVQPFKKGPDYIDPGWLTVAAGRCCRNLDLNFMTPAAVIDSLVQHTRGADLALVEGAMGLYDGLDLAGSNSTAELAKVIAAPVILVIDATRMTRSAAAMVMGYQHFDPGVNIAGVIFNNVARPRHAGMLRAVVEEYCGVPVLGMMPREKNLNIKDRHLGLVTVAEHGAAKEIINDLMVMVAENVDLSAVMNIAESAPTATAWIAGGRSLAEQQGLSKVGMVRTAGCKIGVLRDRVFTFYYQENLEALESLDAELVYLDALKDTALPGDLAALYLGGGFPELFAGQLEENSELRREIYRAARAGMPIYAECGGLMYLARHLVTPDGIYEMAGVLPLDVAMTPKPQGHGYTIMRALPGNPFFVSGSTVKGHEFHNSRVINLDEDKVGFGLEVVRGSGINGCYDGVMVGNVFAGYNHLHVAACPTWAENFICLARREAGNRFVLSVG